MSWFRLEGRGAFHHKVIAAGDEAYGAWCRAGQWSSDQLTDGLIPMATAMLINRKPKIWARLCEVKLAHEVSDGYQIHDFLDFNPSSEQERAKREEMREKRRESGRAGGKRSGEVRRSESEAKRSASLPEASVKQSASTGALLQTKQNEPPSPSPSPLLPTEEDPPYPPQAGVGSGRKKRSDDALTPSEQAYSDAYVAGQLDAEPGCGFCPLKASACRMLGAIAAAHAKGPDGSKLTGEVLLVWFRTTSAEYRRAAEPKYSKGFTPHSFGTWLDSGRPVTREVPLPSPAMPPRTPREPPPVQRPQRMTIEEQNAKQQAAVERIMAEETRASEGT